VSGPRRAVLGATAAAVLVGTLAGPLVPGAAAAPDPRADGVLGLAGSVLTVESLQRVDGAVRVTATLGARGPESVQTAKALRSYTTRGTCIALDLVDPATGRRGTPVGSASGDCRASVLPASVPAGQQVRFVTDVSDPGGSVLDVLPAVGGAVHAVPVSGATTTAAADVRTLRPRRVPLSVRIERRAARITRGARTSVDLDTDVLFAVDSARLTGRAARTLDAAVSVLRGQPARRLGVYGHTDSTGTSAHNRTLSRQRAQAVRAALASRLGAGWTFTVQGFGETRPLVPEITSSGAPDPAARRLNRRVEIAVLG
jgi:outer membrane protein OmpA-like peptidoglycan-associated protein